MDKVAYIENRSKKFINQNKLFWLIISGIVLSVIGGALFCLCNDNGDKEDDTQKTPVVINTKEDAEKYLRENSNYSAGTLKELDFNSYWPKEYFTISIKDKKISYWKDGASVAEVEYHNSYYFNYNIKTFFNNNIKTLKYASAKEAFAKFPADLEKKLESHVDEEYRKAIDKAFNDNKIDEAEKDLSILYNALAAHHGSYILLGRANENGDWKRYQPTDFPTYTMPSEKDLIALARKHAANPDSMAKATPLGESFQALVNSISVKAVSFDYRGDKIWYGDENRAVATKKERINLKLPYDYSTLNGTAACGWVVPNGKEELENAKEYYSNIHFIDENTYNALKNLKWDAPKVEPQTPEWLLVLKKIAYYAGIVFICLGVILLFVAVLPFVVGVCKNFSKTNRMSNDFKKIITNAEVEGERKFKESKAYKKLEAEAQNWRSLSSYTSEDKVITFLNNTHKMISTFPLLNTLNNIYAEAKAEGKNERELVAVILAALDKQTGKPTGLQAFYNDLVVNADYAVAVRDRFESIKAISQKFGERKEYKCIVSKGGDLTIWERLAVMLWATECTNELLKLFGKEHFTAEVLAKAAEIHKEDVMQIFATRIFKQLVDDFSAPVGALTASRERLMAEKLAEMQSKYNVSMFETRIYRDFVAALDLIHDTLKSR